ncbi:MAG TPA: MFS transporter [Solirubrobacteraceae bacterium]|nr:MFS transporter [Solirubrobacteraceae bacterium]
MTSLACSSRRLSLGLWAIGYAYFAQLAFSTAPSPLYALYARRDHFSALVITLVFAAYAVGVLASLLLASHRSDVHGRRPHLLVAVALAAAGAGVFLVWRALPGLFLARVLAGIAVGLTMSTATAHISELHRARHPHAAPGRVQRIVAGASLGGMASGALVAGLLARYVSHPLTVPYLVLLGMLGLAGAGIAIAPETRRPRRPLPAYRPQRITTPAGARRPFFAALTGIFFAYATPAVFIGLAGTFLARVVHRGSPALAGASLFIVFAPGVGLVLATGARSSRRLLAAGLVLAIVGLGLIVVAAWLPSPSLGLFLVGGGAIGASAAALFKATLRSVMAISPGSRLGETLAGYYLAAYLGLSIPAIGVGIALRFLAPRVALLAFAILVSGGLLAVSRVLLGDDRRRALGALGRDRSVVDLATDLLRDRLRDRVRR